MGHDVKGFIFLLICLMLIGFRFEQEPKRQGDGEFLNYFLILGVCLDLDSLFWWFSFMTLYRFYLGIKVWD